MPTLRRRGDRWQAQVRVGGRTWSRTLNTKAAARAWALELEDAIARGIDPSAERAIDRAQQQRFAAWAQLWFDARVAERTTLAQNRGYIDRHLLPEFGALRLVDITHLQVQSWVQRLEARLAPSTVRDVHRLLHTILAAAVRDRLLTYNPAANVRLPQLSPSAGQFLTVDQVQRIAGHCPAPYRTVVLTLAYTGVRWGELAGLHAGQLHMLRRRMDVTHVVEEINGRLSLRGYPKTVSSRRTVPLAGQLVEALAQHLAEDPPVDCGLAHPDGENCSGLVFHGPRGSAMRRMWNARVWRPALTSAGVTSAPRPHDLRHTCASWLVQAGVPLYDVRAWLGHSSIKVTERYAHLAPDQHDRALAALELLPLVRHSAKGRTSR
jgi:integrase